MELCARSILADNTSGMWTRLGVHVLQPLCPLLGAPHISSLWEFWKAPTQQRLAGRPRGRV